MGSVWTGGAYCVHGRILAWAGQVAESLACAERGVAFYEKLGIRCYRALMILAWGEGLLLAGDLERARQVGDRALKLAVETSEHGIEAEVLHLVAEIAFADGSIDVHEARGLYESSHAFASRLGMRPLLAHCHLGFGKLYRRMGGRAEAAEHFKTATAMYREMNMTYWLEQAKTELRE